MNMDTNGDITYRILPPEEWDKLRAIYPATEALPHPVVASAVVAEQGGELVGVLFLQMAIHMEPLILTTPQASFKHMATMLKEALPENLPFYVFAPDEKIERMADIMKMRSLGYKVYVGQGGV